MGSLLPAITTKPPSSVRYVFDGAMPGSAPPLRSASQDGNWAAQTSEKSGGQPTTNVWESSMTSIDEQLSDTSIGGGAGVVVVVSVVDVVVVVVGDVVGSAAGRPAT